MPEKLDGAPNLLNHQVTSKKVAGDWINSVRINIYQSNADLGAYSTKFQNFYTLLYPLAGNLTDDNKVKFTKGLNLLETDLANNFQSSKAALTELEDFNINLETSLSALQTDYININATYEGDKGELVDLTKSLKADRAAAAKDNIIIAEAATGAIVSGLIIAVGVAAEIETVGASTALVVVGLAGEGASGTAIALAVSDLIKKDKAIAKFTSQIATLTSEIALIETVAGQLSLMVEKGKAAESALGVLVKQWQVLDTQLKTVIDSVDGLSVSDGPFLQVELDSANEGWKKTQNTVGIITNQLVGIPVEQDSASTPLALPMFLGGSVSSRNMVAHKPSLTRTASASASASSKAIVSGLQTMGNTIAHISASLLHQPSAASQAKPQLMAVTSNADTVEASSTKVAVDLSKIASKWIPPLTEIAKSLRPDLDNARVQVQGLSKSLQAATKDIKAAQSDAASMNTATLNAITTLADIVNNKLVPEEDTLLVDIANMKNQISTLNKKIAKDRKYEELGWIVGPLGALIAGEIGDLVDNVSGKEKRITGNLNQVKADKKIIAQIMSSIAWCKSTNEYSKKLETQVSGLLQAIQALHAELNTASSQAMPDNLFQEWVASQVGAIVGALNQLVKPEATASFGVIRPAMAAKAQRVVSNAGFSVETSAGLLGNMTSECITTSNAASLILKQPSLEFSLVPTVASDQAVLVTTCEDWHYDYNEDVLQILSSTADVSNMLQKLFSSMMNMAHDESDQLIQGLKLAERRLEKLGVQVESTSHSLEVDFLRLELGKNNAAFGVDRTQVEDKYNGEDGVFAKIQNEITATQNEIDAYLAKLAQGATSTVVKALELELVIGVAAGIGALELPAAATGASELTVLAYKEATAKVQEGSASVRKQATAELKETIGGEGTEKEGQAQIDKLRDLVVSEAQLSAALTSFAVISQQLDTLQSAAQNLTHAIDCIPLDIDILCRDINLLLVKVEAGQSIKHDLDVLSIACGKLSKVCNNLTNTYLASGVDVVTRKRYQGYKGTKVQRHSGAMMPNHLEIELQ